MKLLLLILLFLFGCSNQGNNSNDDIGDNSQKCNIIQKPLLVKAMTETVSEYDTVSVTINKRHYLLFPDGKIAVKSNDNHRTDTFHLKTELIVDKAYFFDYKDYLLIYYSTTDFDCGSSYIEAYDRKTNMLKWENDIYGFNLTEPIVIRNISYVASTGFIGKINLDNGKYLWQHDKLYEKTKFDVIEKIIKEGESVIFIQSNWSNENQQPGRIIVNDSTGVIEKIIINAP